MAGVFLCYNLCMKFRIRRVVTIVTAFLGVVAFLLLNPASYEALFVPVEDSGDYTAEAVTVPETGSVLATELLEKLEVKGRAPKTGYSREEFYNGWPTVDGCNLRQKIIKREFGETAVLSECNVMSGEYDEPYTGEHKVYSSKEEISKGIQIDHVVALSDAWQKGAQYASAEVRYQIATDPLNLLAVDASAKIGRAHV